jgi:D-alanyl-D-alanine dipeptidase
MNATLMVLGVFAFANALAQTNYGVHPMLLSDYALSVKSNPEKKLVRVDKEVPSVVLDIRYATTNNFTSAKVYRLARAYTRAAVAQALKSAQQDFIKLGYGIKIYDAYRPYSATVKFYELMKGDTTYVANPYKGSRHNRGCAVDMTLVDLGTKQELKMPTAYDAMQKESWPSTEIADPVARANRDTLIKIMEKNGFKVYSTEWWHFDFIGWEKFEVMDINFEELE